MPALSRSGVTLPELLIGVLVGSVVAAAAVRALVAQHEYHRAVTGSVAATRTVAAAGALFTSEFAGLAPDAPGGGDLLDVGPAAVRYRALRQLYVLCMTPARGVRTLTVTHDWIGADPIDLGTDSVLILVADSSGVGRWIHADPVAIEGATCPGDRRGRAIRLGGPLPAGAPAGTPVRAGPVVEVRAYPSRREYWIGTRRRPKRGRPASIQPVLGPFEPGGVRFALVDRFEREVTDRARAAGLLVLLIPVGWRDRDPVRPPARIVVAFRSALR